ncbi:MAG: DUF72 domain-containing protein [Kofleriaceae bacterium]|nr:MAG: DUF72 domain-containing protein [Kofleriaceae bacterium]
MVDPSPVRERGPPQPAKRLVESRRAAGEQSELERSHERAKPSAGAARRHAPARPLHQHHRMRGRAFIGTSGWVYPTWRKHLYAGVPMRAWLRRASETFDALEINGSFYTQIASATYARWAAETPPEFRFTLKGHRFVTHYRRLGDCTDSVIRLRDPARGLGRKLLAVLWQLPSRFACDLARLDGFLTAIEHWPEVRHVLEPRHRSWFVPACR